jgi:hypothetical protein
MQVRESEMTGSQQGAKYGYLKKYVCFKYSFIFSLILSAILFLTLNAQAQERACILKVSNQQHQPLDLVTITIKDDTNKVILSGITDSLGIFSWVLSATASPLTFQVSRIGYFKKDTTLSLQPGQVITFLLQQNPSELKAIQVTARKPIIERKTDRLIFNVENNVNISGMDAMEVLAKTPLVKVQQDAISIVGKEEVGILYNDKVLYLSGDALRLFLKSIPSEQIVRIEVITNPPAQYDPTGNGGLINIVTKRIKKIGYWANYNTSAVFARSSFVGRNSLNVNYNRKKLQWFANINFGRGDMNNYYRDDIFYTDKTWKQDYVRKEFSNVLNGSIGFEWPVSSRTNIGVSFTGMNSYPDTRDKVRTNIFNTTDLLDSFLVTQTYTDKLFLNRSANLHFGHVLDSSGKKLEIDLDYYGNDFDTKGDINNVNYWGNGNEIPKSRSRYISENNREANVLAANAMLKIPLKRGNLDVGAKFTRFYNYSDVRLHKTLGAVLQLDTSNTNQFKVTEYVKAVFASYRQQFTDKIEAQAGIRAEWSSQEGYSPTLQQKNTNTYFSIFPTFFLKYDLNAKNAFTFSYGRRFNRPRFSSLNPFRVYDNFFAYTEGNPDLRPFFSNNLELNYTYNNFLYTVLSYSSTTNAIRSIVLIDDRNNFQVTKPYNYLSTATTALTVGASIDKIKRLNSENEFSAYYTDVASTLAAAGSNLSGWGANFRTSNTYTFNKARTIAGSVDLTWQLAELSGISRNKSFYYLDFSFRYAIPKKQLQFNLSLRDVLNTRNLYWTEIVNGITRNSFVNNNTRRLSLSARYTFGNNKIGKGKSYSGSGAEQGRVN